MSNNRNSNWSWWSVGATIVGGAIGVALAAHTASQIIKEEIPVQRQFPNRDMTPFYRDDNDSDDNDSDEGNYHPSATITPPQPSRPYRDDDFGNNSNLPEPTIIPPKKLAPQPMININIDNEMEHPGGSSSHSHIERLVLRSPKKINEKIRNREIIIVSSADDCRQAFEKIQWDLAKCGMLGFSCEWKNNNNGNGGSPFLFQLASLKYCLLIRINLLNVPQLPKDFKTILSNNSIIKTGIKSRENADILFEKYGLSMSAMLDLKHLSKQHGCKYGKDANLHLLSKLYIDMDLNRFQSTFCDPNATQLSQEDVLYAACKAIACYDLFQYFHEELGGHSAEEKKIPLYRKLLNKTFDS